MTARPELRFSWVSDRDNTSLQIAYRLLTVAAIAVASMVALLFPFAVISSNQALFILGGAVIMLLFLLLIVRSYFRATVLVRNDQLIVRSSSGTQTYPWPDIASFAVQRPSRVSPMMTLLRIPQVPYLEMQLKTVPRVHLWRNRSGTNVAGIPQPFRRLELRVREVDELATAVADYVPLRD